MSERAKECVGDWVGVCVRAWIGGRVDAQVCACAGICIIKNWIIYNVVVRSTVRHLFLS